MASVGVFPSFSSAAATPLGSVAGTGGGGAANGTNGGAGGSGSNGSAPAATAPPNGTISPAGLIVKPIPPVVVPTAAAAVVASCTTGSNGVLINSPIVTATTVTTTPSVTIGAASAVVPVMSDEHSPSPPPPPQSAIAVMSAAPAITPSSTALVMAPGVAAAATAAVGSSSLSPSPETVPTASLVATINGDGKNSPLEAVIMEAASLFCDSFKLMDDDENDDVPLSVPVSLGSGGGTGSVIIPTFEDLDDAVAAAVAETTTDISSNNGHGAVNARSTSVEALTGFPLENASLSDCMEQDCTLCQSKYVSPRVLSCLHVFCEACLEKQLLQQNHQQQETDSGGKLAGMLECPTCKQLTNIAGCGGIAGLHADYILTNVLDLSAIEPAALACTSCKSKEMAISRCNDCANFLCASCDNAHRYMRCFEDHKVLQLEELRASAERVAIHKPLYCSVHPGENLKYFCFNCQLPVCNECLIGEHKGKEHNYQIISEAEKPMRAELEALMGEARRLLEGCNRAGGDLDASLHDLQAQFETARGAINETFQSFRAVLERCRDAALKSLERLHSERELKIMDSLNAVEKCKDSIEGTARFTKKVLDQANGPELLSLKKMICAQFTTLAGATPKVGGVDGIASLRLEFRSNFERFEKNAPELFGTFRTEADNTIAGGLSGSSGAVGTVASPKETTPPPSLPGMSLLLNKPPVPSAGATAAGIGLGLGSGLSQGPLTGSVTASSPISLPTSSMQSSFDGELSGIGSSYPLLPHVLTPEPPAVVTSSPLGAAGAGTGAVVPAAATGSGTLPGLTSIAEYNLHRLANLAESSAAASDVGLPDAAAAPPTNFTLADLISGDQNAYQALAKFSLNSTDLQTGVSLPPVHPGMDGLSLSLSDFSPAGTGGPGHHHHPHHHHHHHHPHQLPPLDAAAGGAGATAGAGSAADMANAAAAAAAMGRFQVNGRTKATPMQIRCKFGSLGQTKGQFNSPHGFCLGVDEEIVVADTNNHRIEIFEKNGTFKFSFGVPGKEEGQLFYPRKVAVMRASAKFVVCDRGNERSRMQIFSKNGHFIKKIAIRYIDIVAGLAVTNKGLIVAVDSVSPTVFIISEDGNLIHWFDCSDFMREPSDIAINGSDFYVCDFKGHCVAVFSEEGTFKYRIGSEKVTCFPNGIDISDAGDVLIGDSHGNRFHVACYSKDGQLQSEYECPYVKVSRCCGLKITSEGYVVTLAKNNHHVLVLNTLYIQ